MLACCKFNVRNTKHILIHVFHNFSSHFTGPMLKDDDFDQEVRPQKDIASILQNIHKQSPVISSCTSGDEEVAEEVAKKPPGGPRRFANRGIEG